MNRDQAKATERPPIVDGLPVHGIRPEILRLTRDRLAELNPEPKIPEPPR